MAVDAGQAHVANKPVVPVVAAALFNPQGQVLINERPAGKPLAGYWEFPGGKLEVGESSVEALIRELREELAVVATAFQPLISLRHEYAERIIELTVFRGEIGEQPPQSLEAQRLAWVAPQQLHEYDLLPANGPIVKALLLPSYYAISPEPPSAPAAWPEFITSLKAQVQRHSLELVQLRAKQLEPASLVELVKQLYPVLQQLNCQMLVNGQASLLQELPADGLQLPSTELQNYTQRPVPNTKWFGVSCHTAADLVQASKLEADFALLGSVQASNSHPSGKTLGWAEFARLSQDVNVPVYALGGLQRSQLAAAKRYGAQGIAGISTFQE